MQQTKVACLQSEFCTKYFLSYEVSYEKCFESFPKVLTLYSVGLKKPPQNSRQISLQKLKKSPTSFCRSAGRTTKVMAHETTFQVVIHGRGGHGSQPHACIDPVVCGAAVVMALQTIVSRSLPSSSNAVVTVAMFQAGAKMSIIPDTATISGTE